MVDLDLVPLTRRISPAQVSDMQFAPDRCDFIENLRLVRRGDIS